MQVNVLLTCKLYPVWSKNWSFEYYPINLCLCLLCKPSWSESSITFRTIVTQSICIHYSCFEKMGRFVTLKKNQVQKMDLKKAGWKKYGHCYSKREEAALLLLFLNNNDSIFYSLLFSGPYFGLIFLKFQTLKKCLIDLIN